MEAFQQSLQDAGVDDVITAKSAQVPYMAIPELHYIPVNAINSVLRVGDPRRDAYLENVFKLFISGNSQLAYVPSHRGLAFYRRILRKNPELRDITILDDRRSQHFLAAGIFLLGLVLLNILIPGSSLQLSVGALSWAVLVYFCGFLMASLALMHFVVVQIRSARCNLTTALISVAIIVLAIVFLIPSNIFFPALIAILALEGVAAFSVKKTGGEKRRDDFFHLFRQDHLLFKPLPLSQIGAPMRIHGTRFFLLRLLLGSILTFFPLFLHTPDVGHVPVPGADKAVGAFHSFNTLQQLTMMKNAEALPNVVDLLNSRIYQEGFLYGAKYRFPHLNTQLRVFQYKDTDQGIHVNPVDIVQYNTENILSILNAELEKGIGVLFATLGGPAPIKWTRQPLHGFNQIDLSAWSFFLMIALLCLTLVPAFFLHKVHRILRYNAPLNLIRKKVRVA